MNMEDDNQVVTEENKNRKILWIILALILLLILLLGGYYLFTQTDTAEEAEPTPTVFQEETDDAEEDGFLDEDLEDLTPTIEITPAATPTQGVTPSPTSAGPGGLQSNPTNTPTPTSLPLSY